MSKQAEKTTEEILLEEANKMAEEEVTQVISETPEQKNDEVEEVVKKFKTFDTEEEFNEFVEKSNKDYTKKAFEKRFKNKEVPINKVENDPISENETLLQLKEELEKLTKSFKKSEAEKTQQLKENKLKKLNIKQEDIKLALILYDGLLKEGISEKEVSELISKKFVKVNKKPFGVDVEKTNEIETDETLEAFRMLNPDLKI